MKAQNYAPPLVHLAALSCLLHSVCALG